MQCSRVSSSWYAIVFDLGFSCSCIKRAGSRLPFANPRRRTRNSMSTQMGERGSGSRSSSWRTPAIIILCGCAIGMLGFGPRSALGFFVQPMSHEFSWGRDVFGLAIAVQNLLWGLGQPFAGAVADRFGLFRVMCVGALLYAGGLLLLRFLLLLLLFVFGVGVL